MRLDGRFRFENFVGGAANRLAFAAARACADAPGTVYNPLVIYGSSGLGKTHLAVAIGYQVSQRRPSASIAYLTLDDFVEQLHVAIAANGVDGFKRRLQGADVLIIDDVQFLTGKRETQAELLRLCSVLQEEGRQIVLTSDRPPTEIPDVDERLLNRFAGGLLVDVGMPDYETRLAIVQAQCEDRGVRFQAGVHEALARLDIANVRELHGLLNRLVAHQTLGDRAVTPDEVAPLTGRAARPAAQVTPEGPRGSDAPVDAVAATGEFESFLLDVASTLAESVADAWRTRLGEAITYWSAEGYGTAPLARALDGEPPADVEAVVRAFGETVERLRVLERDARAIDPTVAASAPFRDPDRLDEAGRLVEQLRAAAYPPPGPSAAFSRAGYEVSACNQLAVRAADAIVQEPGRRYNPLFVHGPSGVGKTHLLHAIGNELVDASGGATRVACVTAQEFMDELVSALRDGTVERWRARYRAIDALVVDDVQFVVGKERTQEELFHVFNALHGEGRQLVFASDCPPATLSGLEERLRSRFAGGLVVEMRAPDRALRERLYARALADAGLVPQADLVTYLASRDVSSAREILGVVHRLAAMAELQGVHVTVALARQELEPEPVAVAGRPPRRASTPGIDPTFLDDEKVIWEWPDIGGRAIEELR